MRPPLRLAQRSRRQSRPRASQRPCAAVLTGHNMRVVPLAAAAPLCRPGRQGLRGAAPGGPQLLIHLRPARPGARDRRRPGHGHLRDGHARRPTQGPILPAQHHALWWVQGLQLLVPQAGGSGGGGAVAGQGARPPFCTCAHPLCRHLDAAGRQHGLRLLHHHVSLRLRLQLRVRGADDAAGVAAVLWLPPGRGVGHGRRVAAGVPPPPRPPGRPAIQNRPRGAPAGRHWGLCLQGARPGRDLWVSGWHRAAAPRV